MAAHPVTLLPDHPRLLPGLRVLRRDAAHLQVGVGARAVLVPDHPDVRRLLGLLTSGAAPAAEHLPRPHTPAGEVLARLAGAGLLVDGAALQTELHRSDADPAGDPAARHRGEQLPRRSMEAPVHISVVQGELGTRQIAHSEVVSV